jgi:hypothetical protein
MVNILEVGAGAAVAWLLLGGKKDDLKSMDQRGVEKIAPPTIDVPVRVPPTAPAQPAPVARCRLVRLPPLPAPLSAEEQKLASIDTNQLNRDHYAKLKVIHETARQELRGVSPMYGVTLWRLEDPEAVKRWRAPYTTDTELARRKIAEGGLTEAQAIAASKKWAMAIRSAIEEHDRMRDAIGKAKAALRSWEAGEEAVLQERAEKLAQYREHYYQIGWTVQKVDVAGKTLYYACPPGVAPPRG